MNQTALHREWHRAPDASAVGHPGVLLHGFAANSRLNPEPTGWLEALARAGRDVLVIDLPGHGQSRDIVDPERNTSTRPCRAVSALIGERVPARGTTADRTVRVDPAGYPIGARPAWDFATTYPNQVHRMVPGAPALDDPFRQFDTGEAHTDLHDGAAMSSPRGEQLLTTARQPPENKADTLLRVIHGLQQQRFEPYPLRSFAVLRVAGTRDDLAATLPEQTRRAYHSGIHRLAGRNHRNAVSARAQDGCNRFSGRRRQRKLKARARRDRPASLDTTKQRQQHIRRPSPRRRVAAPPKRSLRKEIDHV